MATSGSILGNAVLRREDPKLLIGANDYLDDMTMDGMAHIVFVRSPFAHATVQSVETSEAASMPGVIAVISAADLGIDPVQGFAMLPPTFNRPPLATDRVRFVGDMVVAVVAETRAQAADAAEAVVVDYDPLPAVADPEAALADGAPLIFPDHGSNIAFETAHAAPDDGDAMQGADAVVSERIVSQRLAGVPMENNGFLAVPGDGKLTAYASTQAAHGLRDALAPALGMDGDAVRVIAPWVGGGFGPKAGLYLEYVVAAKAAMDLGRPVKWAETRSENMLSMAQGRGFVMETKMGITKDGKIVGLEADVVADAGAYPMVGAILPMLTQMMSNAVYEIPRIKFHARTAITNTTPTAAYRGAGRPEATQMVERILDCAAKAVGLDPADVRRRNFIPAERFPLTTLTGANYDSGEYDKALEAALKASGYDELRSEQARRRESGDQKLLGIGLSSYVEVTAPIGLHSEYGAVEVNEDGTVTVTVGTAAHGQGHETAFSMIVASALGVPMDAVRLVQSDTDLVPQGAGTMGSRSLQTAGNAVHEASNTVLAKAKDLAAHLLEASAEDIVVGEGGLQVSGVPQSALTWAELAVAANDDSKRPEGMEPGLEHHLVFDEGDATYPFGSHVAVVEVDRETGRVELLRHVAVDDCGTILNPLLVAGQQHGGIGQGIAQALFEWVRYDDDGNPVSATLMDYLIPSAAELPSFEVSNTETASPRNPLGAKGIGESGTIGSTPAVHNAVVDAVSHLGITHIDMPCGPERVWEALQAASA
jgi:aerobic carbon-monoxide dehydrogenase large subunit